MASIPQSSTNNIATENSRAEGEGSYTVPLIIITILFFMWGAITSLNDVLIPHLKAVYSLSYKQAALVQVWFFGAYFLVSLPAGFYVRSFGYQKGAITGLVIAAAGCALFYPAATNGYFFFLFAFFIMAAGITVLQVAANPYVAVLGPAKTASSRLNLTQALNSAGASMSPIVIGGLILGSATFVSEAELATFTESARNAYKAAEAASVQVPYLIVAGALLLLAGFFAVVKLPKIETKEVSKSRGFAESMVYIKKGLSANPHLTLGVIGIFLYVGAEVSIGSWLINFIGLPNVAAMPLDNAKNWLATYWAFAMIGRFIGFAVMLKVSAGKVLTFNSATAILLVLIATFNSGNHVLFDITIPVVTSWNDVFKGAWHLKDIAFTQGYLAMVAITLVGLFNSIMFPTIFTMALHKLGNFTSQGSGLLCMGIVGGAVVPFMHAALADAIGLQLSFLLPAACYVFILYFGFKYMNMHTTEEEVLTQEPVHP